MENQPQNPEFRNNPENLPMENMCTRSSAIAWDQKKIYNYQAGYFYVYHTNLDKQNF